MEQDGLCQPVRVTKWKHEPLRSEEREKLFEDFTAWYYENGNGMLLGGGTRSIYLRVKDNLVCPIDYYEPESVRERLKTIESREDQEKERGRLSIRQLSLLRSRMKADLEVYGLPYHTELNDDDKALLRWCGEDPSSKAWSGRQRDNEKTTRRGQERTLRETVE